MTTPERARAARGETKMTDEDFKLVDALIARRMATTSAPAERYIEGRRVKPHATVQDGMVYDLRGRRWGNTLGWLLTFVVFGALAWLILPGLAGAPSATTRTQPTAPAYATTGPRPTYAAPTTTDYGIAAYNAAQDATATALQEAPSGAGAAPEDIPTPAPAWHAPMVPDYDVCAAWHVPLPWPAECGAQESWHAPMSVKP